MGNYLQQTFFFYRHLLTNNFFPFFSVFLLFVLNITIALLNYETMMYREQKGHSIRNERNVVLFCQKRSN